MTKKSVSVQKKLKISYFKYKLIMKQQKHKASQKLK